MRLGVVIIIACIAVFLIVITFAVLRDRSYRKKHSALNPSNDKWLFSNWAYKVYHTFTKKDPAVIASKIGINVKHHLQSCKIMGTAPYLEDIIVKKCLGISVVLLSAVSYLILRSMPVCFIGLMLGAVLTFVPGKKTEISADNKRYQLEGEFPRFLDLLQTALFINLPIEEAVKLTASHLDQTLLSQEFIAAMTDIRIGSVDWQEALEIVSDKYELDELSDFVLDLTISHKKGLSIYDMVVKRNKDIKQSTLLKTKEKATKANNIIMFPIVLFNLVPMLAIMIIPIITQLNESFS